ncbi:acetyl-CoA carboxylase biotin carboxyl carrier protein [Pseudogulbenkiania ferrooxidans]|uniref:Biotin carboxyl carrier protein of acetyl-CoA carboxylase n=1 Tax=Pseudogulbenkiania ferrooxidans 2002 TaxID=279714 RepID=B9YY51_9NEIS|nr:acetyl-CoA carboxylase biotin carboxyl carrier protein [Pseudogulbenkiania ferrooxidans]EEG10054.1 acetyl-CoA carboxylase, biotin carboxyl carrier protein [Pseudogulbenkiania ferrooxidans 2002]
MELRKLKQLIQLVQASGIAELEISAGSEQIRITRTVAGTPTVPAQLLPAPLAVVAPASATAAPAAAPSPSANPNTVKSPMVGSFYRRPSPQASAFVEVGQPVKVGDTLCIIEAMKLMNEIEADRAGVLKAILVEEGQPVEFGEPLFVIE